jgi:hypothetical protein
MKNIILSGLVVLSTNAMSSTSDSRFLPIRESDTVDSLSLFTTTTRTEYRVETEARTCYRTIIDGYRRVCNRYSEVRPPLPPREPREPRPPMPPRPPVCYDEPVYRTVPYTCYETVRYPYEVIDHQTQTNVNVSMKNVENVIFGAQCGIQFTAIGDSLSAQTNCNEYLVTANTTNNSFYDRGTLVQNADYKISLYDRQKLLAPLAGGLTNLHVEGQTVVVNTGDLNRGGNFTLKLFVERRRFLKEDEVLINRNLNAGEYNYSNGMTRIDLAKVLGGINTSKKHKIKLSLGVVLPVGNILNNNIPSLYQESEITVWEN